MSFTRKGMELSQSHKDKYPMVSLICGIYRGKDVKAKPVLLVMWKGSGKGDKMV
jgi:hypothetical protein